VPIHEQAEGGRIALPGPLDQCRVGHTCNRRGSKGCGWEII
jgi:hypothetical protein